MLWQRKKNIKKELEKQLLYIFPQKMSLNINLFVYTCHRQNIVIRHRLVLNVFLCQKCSWNYICIRSILNLLDKKLASCEFQFHQ